MPVSPGASGMQPRDAERGGSRPMTPLQGPTQGRGGDRPNAEAPRRPARRTAAGGQPSAGLSRRPMGGVGPRTWPAGSRATGESPQGAPGPRALARKTDYDEPAVHG